MILYRMRIVTMAVLLGAAFFVAAPHLAAQTAADPQPKGAAVILTLPQTRALAARAIQDKQPKIALYLAGGLLKANPRSSIAHYIKARAYALDGDLARARKSASKAYRYGIDAPQRFEAAELAAKLAYADNSLTMAQLWVRRTAQNTSNAQVEQQLGRDFNQIRSENPLSFSLNGSIRPSNNVNNGADTAVQIIDGSPITGILSGSAQALGGTISSADASLSYRLRGTKKSRTTLAGRLYVQRVTLNSSAKESSPTSTNSDFGATYAALALSHSFAVGTKGNSASFSGTIGQYWSAGSRYYDFARLDARHIWRLSAANTFQVGASMEQRKLVASTSSDVTVVGFSTAFSHARASGDKLRLSFGVLSSDSASINSTSTALTLRANYALARKIGPAQVSAGVVFGNTDYDSYYAAPIFVPEGRHDKSAYADLNLFFPDLDYAGFAPSVTFRAGRKSSNISRFDTRELSMSLGIRSKF